MPVSGPLSSGSLYNFHIVYLGVIPKPNSDRHRQQIFLHVGCAQAMADPGFFKFLPFLPFYRDMAKLDIAAHFSGLIVQLKKCVQENLFYPNFCLSKLVFIFTV